MATSQVRGAMQRLRTVMLRRDGAGLTDGQLLENYVRDREEAALAALVRRHGPMVWGVCRRLLRNHHDAEDAFQATFLVLVRRAASIVPREMVANWLYGVARQTALKARSTAARRTQREQTVMHFPEPAVAEQDMWNDLWPLLDDELSRLPRKYQTVIVLCDVEGMTRKAAARQLGVPEGTIAGWLARARQMLAKRLGRRGFGLSAGALAAVLSANAASAAVPVSVLSSTITAATLFAAGQATVAGMISARTAALTEGVLRSMALYRAKLSVCVALMVGLLAGGTGVYNSRAADRGEPDVANTEQPAQRVPRDEKKLAFASSPAPVQVMASLDKDKKLVIKTNVQMPGDGGMVFGAVNVAGGPGVPPPIAVKMLPAMVVGEVRTRTYDLDKVEVFDTHGRKLARREVLKRLKKETLGLAALDGEAVDPLHLRLIKDGTWIFVLPVPKGAAGAAPIGLVPAIPAVPAVPGFPAGPAVPGPGPKSHD